jgi:hypothetical protein
MTPTHILWLQDGRKALNYPVPRESMVGDLIAAVAIAVLVVIGLIIVGAL